jgi:SAM-dependent methyltransferase
MPVSSVIDRLGFVARHPLASARFLVAKDAAALEMARLADLIREHTPELDDLLDYLELSPSRAPAVLIAAENEVANSWNASGPHNAEEIREWTRTNSAILLDLVRWNVSPEYRRLLEVFEAERDGVCLSFGGGIGTEALRLAEQGNETWYCDLPDSPVWRFARWRAERRDLPIRFSVEIPEDGTFDAVVAFNVFGSLAEEDLPVVLERICAALKPGGRLYCSHDFNSRESHPYIHDHQALWDALCERLPLELVEEDRPFGDESRWYTSVYARRSA